MQRPRQRKAIRYALLDERAPAARAHKPRDAGAALASRYCSGRGPATLQDFARWSGLAVARAGGASSVCRVVDGVDP